MLKYNNINNMLNELKNQIDYIINDIINESEKIKLNPEIKEYKNDNSIYNNFIIGLKNAIYVLNEHKNSVTCATVLNDGRFAN